MKNDRARRISLLACVMLAIPTATRASDFGTETAKLLASDGSAGDEFGTAVAARNGRAVVGAPFWSDSLFTMDSGAAYLLDTNTGAQIAQLSPWDGAQAGDAFGLSVAISDDIVLVTSKFLTAGAVYVYQADSGNPAGSKITQPGAEAGDHFGWSLAASGDTALIGAPWDDTPSGTKAGSVWLFDSSGTWLVPELYASDAAAGDEFGSSVAIDAGTIVVGAPGGNAAYLFDEATHAQLAKLQPGDTADAFGCAVAISQDRVVVGAQDSGFVFEESGAAYLFDAVTGVEIAKLVAFDGISNDHFGSSVAIHGNTILVGAPDNSAGSGSVYVFDATTGIALGKLTPSDSAPFDHFGASLALEDAVAFIGAADDDDIGSESGSVYRFDVAAGEWADLGSGLAGGAGVPTLFGWGPQLPGCTVNLALNNGPSNASAYLVFGLSQLAAPFKGGLLVPAPDILIPGLTTSAAGSIGLSFTWPAGVPAEVSLYYQYWLVDAGGPAGFSASNGLQSTSP